MSATANKVDFRRLELRDLTAIETIERASYPTPWSRSMFAGELAKPSSISLGAFEPDTRRLLGYLIISRYVDAWHVMNLAVAPDHRRKRIATSLLERLFELTAGEGRRGYTLEVRISNEVAIRHNYLDGSDLFLIADQVNRNGSVDLKALQNPLVNLIWFAGFVFLGGSLIALWPDAREERRLAARYAGALAEA